jgi:hypothetical protein
MDCAFLVDLALNFFVAYVDDDMEVPRLDLTRADADCRDLTWLDLT